MASIQQAFVPVPYPDAMYPAIVCQHGALEFLAPSFSGWVPQRACPSRRLLRLQARPLDKLRWERQDSSRGIWSLRQLHRCGTAALHKLTGPDRRSGARCIVNACACGPASCNGPQACHIAADKHAAAEQRQSQLGSGADVASLSIHVVATLFQPGAASRQCGDLQYPESKADILASQVSLPAAADG